MKADANRRASSSPQRRALCVGINAYSDAQQLTGAVADAILWRHVLAAQGFDVSVLLDRDATALAILNGIRTLAESSRLGDVLVFAFSGFGSQVPDPVEDDTLNEVLLPVNYAEGEFITDDDFDSLASTLPPGVNLTSFLDCCYAGTISRFVVGHSQDSTPRDQRPRFLALPREWLSRFESRRRATPPSLSTSPAASIAFNACRSSEVAWEKDGQGEFTRRAASLLAGGIPRLSNREYHQRIVEAFGPTPRQTPVLYAEHLAEQPFLGVDREHADVPDEV